MVNLVAEHELDEIGERNVALFLWPDHEYDGAVQILILRLGELGLYFASRLFERVEDSLPVFRRLTVTAAEHVFAAQRLEQHRLFDDEGPAEMQRVVRPLVRPEIRLVAGICVHHSKSGRSL